MQEIQLSVRRCKALMITDILVDYYLGFVWIISVCFHSEMVVINFEGEPSIIALVQVNCIGYRVNKGYFFSS